MGNTNLKVAASTEVRIDKGVPILRPHGPSKYPFHEMEVGDSFLFPATVLANAAHTAARANSRDGKTFKTRKTAEGHRCWRTA